MIQAIFELHRVYMFTYIYIYIYIEDAYGDAPPLPLLCSICSVCILMSPFSATNIEVNGECTSRTMFTSIRCTFGSSYLFARHAAGCKFSGEASLKGSAIASDVSASFMSLEEGWVRDYMGLV